MTGKPPSPAPGDVIKTASFVLGPLTAWLYLTGWSYAYAYFDHLRIPLLMVDLPTQHVFVYGGLVVWKNWLWTLLVFVSFAATLWACYRFSSTLGLVGLTGITVVVVLALFILGRVSGASTAWDDFQIQRDHDYRAYPRVRLSLAKNAPSLDSQVVADLVASDCGRLVLHNQKRLFLIRPVRDASLDLDTFVLPWSEVAALRITSTYASCS